MGQWRLGHPEIDIKDRRHLMWVVDSRVES